ncbi:hypothetical protein IQ276_039315 [Desmonostoc muscorum LEGE 12446]|uniref:Uncharacterized protein n=1 Tax=Desmonostoc muscorum LEGE 12446 TaxID=1828758 RepID=A0A8J6ZLX0_DESMC|nr:hypothetical protein [Desmonostoc muscorum]MCF2152336.1 hypothetical protein [Desmonostoc muscorum LEGE 12446]
MFFIDIPDSWKYLVASLLTGGFGFIIACLNNYFQIKKETKNWEKDKIWNGYQKCISNLNLIDGLWTYVDAENKVNYVLDSGNKEKIFTLSSEIYPYLYWIIYNYPNSKIEAIKTIKEIIKEEKAGDVTTINANNLTCLIFTPNSLNTLKKSLIQLMINDPRLSDKNIRYPF